MDERGCWYWGGSNSEGGGHAGNGSPHTVSYNEANGCGHRGSGGQPASTALCRTGTYGHTGMYMHTRYPTMVTNIHSIHKHILLIVESRMHLKDHIITVRSC